MNIFLQIKIQNQGHVRGEHTFTMCDYVTLCDHVSSYHAPHLQHSSVCHYLKGHSGAELHIYFLVRLESIYYQIFFYSKIVPNCAVAK